MNDRKRDAKTTISKTRVYYRNRGPSGFKYNNTMKRKYTWSPYNKKNAVPGTSLDEESKTSTCANEERIYDYLIPTSRRRHHARARRTRVQNTSPPRIRLRHIASLRPRPKVDHASLSIMPVKTVHELITIPRPNGRRPDAVRFQQ